MLSRGRLPEMRWPISARTGPPANAKGFGTPAEGSVLFANPDRK